ncbi:MAG TPA: tetratricopeptide repeat protein [Salinivirgaceae bacterium]|nr:tetratricopeptide repeat protein [Salinivirgaceae bacterium]
MKPILQLYRFTLLVGYFLFLTISSVSGNKIDSLRTAYTQGDDSVKFEALSDMVVYYRNVDIDSAKLYLKTLYGLSTDNNFFRLGSCQLLDGSIYHLQNLYDSAEMLYNTALKTFSAAKYARGISSCLNNLGALFQDRGNYKKAGEYLFRHLRLADSLGNKKELSTAHTNIGLLLHQQEQYEEALKYYNISLALKKELNDKRGEALLYNNIGITHYYLKNYDNVLDNFKHALAIYQELNDLRGQAMPYYNIGEIYFEAKQDYRSALYHYKKSYDIEQAIGDINGQASSLNRMGACYSALKNYEEAIRVQQQALQMLREINTPVQISFVLHDLSSTFEKIGDFKNALKNYKEFSLIQDSLVSLTNLQQIAKLKEEYETSKKDQEISLLNSEKSLQRLELESRLKDIRSRNILLIVAAIFMAITTFAGYLLLRLYRQSNSLNDALTTKNNIIEQKNSQLSVTYDSVKKISGIKELFLSNVANDLKTPLNVINTFSTQLLSSQIDDNQRYYLEQVRYSSDDLLALLNNLITYNKFNAGILNIEKLPFLIENIVRFLQNSYEQKIVEKNITFKVECKYGNDKIIISDQIRIIQICTILIDNAIKNSFSGDTIECYFFIIKDDTLQIIVKESGYGINEDLLSTSLSDFNALAQSNQSDFNLEINIARYLVELFGGTFNIDSQENKGTTFSINIPIELKEQTDLTTKFDKFVVNTEFYNVLIINESYEKITTILNVLNAYDQNIIFDSADSGEKAELLLKKNRYDIVFIDASMHTAENQDFSDFIRTKLSSNNVPKLLIGTVNNTNFKKEISTEFSGFDDYLFSPFDPQKLISFYENMKTVSKTRKDLEAADVRTLLQTVFVGNNKEEIQKTLDFINHELNPHLFKLKFAMKEESNKEMRTTLSFIKSNLYYIDDTELNKSITNLEKAIAKNDKMRIESEFENLQNICNALQLTINN